MPIMQFLKNPANSVSREKMFFNKLYFDLKLAAAQTGVPLQIFTPEVDRDGFDVVIDDADLERRFQLKSFIKLASTKSWDIHKRLLRPIHEYAQVLGFEFSPEGVGLGGGVILIEIDGSDDACPVSYYYTDIFVLLAFFDGLIGTAQTRDKAKMVIQHLRRNAGRMKAPLPLGVFVKMKSPSCLLAIAGFHSMEDSHCWWGTFLTALGEGFRADEIPASDDVPGRIAKAKADQAVEELVSLIEPIR